MIMSINLFSSRTRSFESSVSSTADRSPNTGWVCSFCGRRKKKKNWIWKDRRCCCCLNHLFSVFSKCWGCRLSPFFSVAKISSPPPCAFVQMRRVLNFGPWKKNFFGLDLIFGLLYYFPSPVVSLGHGSETIQFFERNVLRTICLRTKCLSNELSPNEMSLERIVRERYVPRTICPSNEVSAERFVYKNEMSQERSVPSPLSSSSALSTSSTS